MKRYNITAKTIPGNDTWAEDSRIKIDEADNGEWVRYEDATAPLVAILKLINLEK